MNFCPNCGAELRHEVPEGDDRPRGVCPACRVIHYENPKLVVGCFIEPPDGSDRLLLCKRAIQPALGRWTPPAGYLELGESARAGARRETWEEARARVRITAPFVEFDLSHIGQVYRLYHAVLLGDEFSSGPESSDVRWYDLDKIPIDDLAFPVIHFAVRLYIQDRAAGERGVHLGTLVWDGEGSRWSAESYQLDDHIFVPFSS